MKCIAFMNLKKIGGGGSANQTEIIKAINFNKKLLLQEIDIINPDIIIGCGINDYWKYLIEDLEFKEKVYGVAIAQYNKMRIINYYHPSYRVPIGMTYSLLQNIINSEKFKNL